MSVLEPPGVPRARMLLQRARWAATAFAAYDRATVERIVEAVAEAAYQNGQRYAEWAVRETGMGVVEHKLRKHHACSRGLVERYRGEDHVGARIDADRKLLELPRPAGVVLALTPSTNPISTTYFKVLLCLMTRCAVVVSPHPMAREVGVDACRVLAEAAVRAGAPDGCIQVVEEPTIPLIDALMTDPATDVIVATGGTAVVRAAYRSGNPAIGVGPGNVPALVDATANVDLAAQRLVDSKAFDNSLLCTNESVAIVEQRVADAFVKALARSGAHVCQGEEVDAVRAACFPDGHWDTSLVGKDAATLAAKARIRVAPRTRVLVAPFPLIIGEEPLAREKLFPLLGLVRVPDARRGIDAARALLRIGGAGHSAVIHSRDPRTIMAYGAAVNVLRLCVNAGGSTGNAGLDTHLPISMTIGTGFYGRSSLTENLQPRNLVQWTTIAYNADPSEPFGSFEGLEPWTAQPERVPVAHGPASSGGETDALREEIRRLVLDELRELIQR